MDHLTQLREEILLLERAIDLVGPSDQLDEKLAGLRERLSAAQI